MRPHSGVPSSRLPVFLCLLFSFLLSVAHAEPGAKSATNAFTFVVLGDPQLGFSSNNQEMETEAARLTKAVETINRIKPAFVVMDGDLIHCASEKPEGVRQAQVDRFKTIVAQIDSSIPVHLVPGNHEMTNSPTPQDIAWYTKNFGADHYTFQIGQSLFLVLDSSLIAHPEKVPTEASAQKEWLVQQLEAARKSGITSISIFQHHPWFLKNAAEKDAYDNIPTASRGQYLELLRSYNVRTTISGHLHYPLTVEDAGMKIVICGSIGKSFRGEPGLMLGRSESGKLEFTYVPISKFDSLPQLPAAP